MPELPEVEYYKALFEEHALYRRIDHVEVLEPTILKGTDEKKLNDLLSGKRFEKVERLGKYLCIHIQQGRCLEIHFGMTGEFLYNAVQPFPKSVRAVLFMEEGNPLVFSDRRKLGHLAVASGINEIRRKHRLGPDALEISKTQFINGLAQCSAKIKSLLMNQSFIAGIGNVYSDEILFQAKVHPASVSSVIPGKKSERLYEMIPEVLQVAFECVRQTGDFVQGRHTFPESYLLAHRKENASCPTSCGGKVERIKSGGRSTYFCPACQKLYS